MDTYTALDNKSKMKEKLLSNYKDNEFFSTRIQNYNSDLLIENIEKINANKNFKFEFNYWYVIFLTINAASANFFIGWNMGVFDPIQMNLIFMFKWTETEEKIYLSFISSALQLGAIFGALISGYISRTLGRRKTYLYTNILSFIAIAFTLILNEYSLIFGRFLSGLCVGVYACLVCIYVNEYVPYAITGLCGAIYEVFYCFSIFLSFLSGWNLPSKNEPQTEWWRIMVSIPAITNLINTICLLFVFKYEPAKYIYINIMDIEETKKSLRCIYKREEDVQEMLKDFERLQNVRKSEISFRQLCSEKYRFRLFVATSLMIGQVICGADVIFMYSENIYHKIIGDNGNAKIFTILTGLSLVLSGICSIFIIEKIGRRKLLLVGQSLMVLTLISISVLYYFNYLSILLISLFILFIFLNGVSISPICYIFTSDVLPENGVSLSVMSNFLTDFIVCSSFLFIRKSFLKMSGTIGLYSLFSLIVLVISFKYVKETQNLSSKQIDDIFKKK
jgi:MFS family permease